MSFEFITPIGLLLLFATLIAVIFNAGTVVACLWAGIKLKHVAVFCGKPVFTIQTRFAPVTVGYIPMGGSVQLDMDAFPTKPLLTRCIVTLAGPSALFLSSVICLGLLHAGLSFTATFPQFLEFVMSPASRGKEFFALFFERIHASPVAGYGVFAAKATALHLLPLPGLPGARFLIEFAKKRDASVLAKMLSYVGSLIAVIIPVRIGEAILLPHLKHPNITCLAVVGSLFAVTALVLICFAAVSASPKGRTRS